MRGYFFIYKRTLQSGNKIYYYQAYKPDGTLTSGKSTGCKTKSAAIHYCQTLLMQGRIWIGSNILFTTYAEHFFIISRKSGQKIPKIANLQYYKSKAIYGTKKKSIFR